MNWAQLVEWGHTVGITVVQEKPFICLYTVNDEIWFVQMEGDVRPWEEVKDLYVEILMPMKNWVKASRRKTFREPCAGSAHHFLDLDQYGGR